MWNKIKQWLHCFGSIILTSIICFMIGIIVGIMLVHGDFIISVIVAAAGSVLFVILILCYYRYEYNRIGVEKKRAVRNYKRIFWGIGIFLFPVYIAVVYHTYLETYEHNKFGIDQSQYIILLNLVIFWFCG